MDREALSLVSSRIAHNLENRAFKASKPGQTFETGAIMFSKEYGILGKTESSEILLKKITDQI